MTDRIVSVDETFALPAPVRAKLQDDLGATAPASILGMTVYNPADQQELGVSGNTLVSIAPASLAVTFTAPSSGKVTVHLEAEVTTAEGIVTWGLVKGGAVAQETRTRICGPIAAGDGERKSATMLLTDLTAGQTITLQWAAACTTGGMRLRMGGSTSAVGNGSAVSGAATMIVRDAPF